MARLMPEEPEAPVPGANTARRSQGPGNGAGVADSSTIILLPSRAMRPTTNGTGSGPCMAPLPPWGAAPGGARKGRPAPQVARRRAECRSVLADHADDDALDLDLVRLEVHGLHGGV